MIRNISRVLAAAALVAGSVLLTPAGDNLSPVSTAQALPLLHLNCDVGGQADFGVVNGKVVGTYLASYRKCLSIDGSAAQYSDWTAVVDPVAVLNCPTTKFTGVGKLTWLNRNTMTTVPGTANFTIDLLKLRIDIVVTSGPMTGYKITPAAALVPDLGYGSITCPNGLPGGVKRVFADGLVDFTPA